MSHNEEVYCSAPWRGITVRDGNVRTCCIGTETIGNLKHMPMEIILERSNKFKEITQAFEQKQHHRNCRGCINDEAKFGYSPLRQNYLRNFPRDNNEFELKLLDIRWNNKCNLGCVYCNAESSSVWEDRLALNGSAARRDYDTNLMSWILQQSNNIKELLLVGGEPMLMKQNYELFRILPSDTQISIITNLAYDLENLPCIENLLARPPEKIIWNVSAENLGARYEYVRNGASWIQFEKNLKFLTQHWPNSVSLNIVYGLFCAFDLKDTVDYFVSNQVNKFNMMPVTGNDEISMSFMPEPMRVRAQHELSSIRIWHKQRSQKLGNIYPFDGLDAIYQSLYVEPIQKLSRHHVMEKLNWYDSWQTESKFQNLWPEEYQMLQDHLS